MSSLSTAEPVVASAQPKHPANASRFIWPGLAGLLLSAFVLKYAPAPFVWLGWGWSSSLLLGAWYFGAGQTRVVLFNVAVPIILLAGVETYLTLFPPQHPTYSEPYQVNDDVLGTVPARQVRAHSSESEHGKVVYDVTYTIDENGLRIAPPSSAVVEGSILFFGCSFTFGEGVQDGETMPYQVGIQSGGRYQIYNFGFHGYGPHHMLAAIESGRVKQIVKAPPRYAIYQVLPDHIARVAGKVPYGKHGPRYQLDADGSVHLRGHFDDGQQHPSFVAFHLLGQLRKSAIYRRLENIRPRTNENDLQLLLATVRRSRDLLSAEYPGIQFHVILWRNFPNDQAIYQELQRGFAGMNIPVHLAEDMLQDHDPASKKYWLSEEDAHPNSTADRLLAEYVVNKILSPGSEGP